MELSSPMLNPSVPPQQIPPDELWFGPSPGEFDKTPLTMEGRTVGRSPVRRPGGGGCAVIAPLVAVWGSDLVRIGNAQQRHYYG